MLRAIITGVTFWLAAILFEAARADDCFCLIHSSGGILRGCEAYKAPNDQYPTAVCTDPETGKQSQQTMYSSSEWKRVEGGGDRCTPCKRPARGTAEELPRGPDDRQKPP